MALMFLLFLLSSGFCVEGCKLADSLDSAIGLFGLEVTALYSTDAEKKSMFENALIEAYDGLSADAIKALSDEKQYELANMVRLQMDSSSPYLDWKDLNPDMLRVATERIAIANNPSIADYLDIEIGLLSMKDVVLLACGEDFWFAENKVIKGELLSGCYKLNQPFSHTVSVNQSSLTSDTCMSACRNEEFLFSAIKDNSCTCETRVDGTFIQKSDQCINLTRVVRTGLGSPTIVSSNPKRFNFDPTVSDGAAIENNDLLGIREVVYPGGNSNDKYFIAVHSFSIELYRLTADEHGELHYEYVDHKRWDAVNFQVSQSGKWIEEFTGPLYSVTIPSTGPADLKKAVSFEVVAHFVTHNDTMETDSEIDWSDINSVNNATNLAGRPIPGGAWFHQVYIFHEDLYPMMSRMPVKVTALRLDDIGLTQLMNARTADSFGDFFIKDSFSKYPISIASRVVGRRSFMFIASRNDEVNEAGSVSLYETDERIVKITDYAKYGQCVLEKKTEVVIDHPVAISYVDSLLFPYLLVLHKDTVKKTSKIYVYRIISFVQMKKVYELELQDYSYYDIKFIKAHGDGMIYVKSTDNSRLFKMSVQGQVYLTEYVLFDKAVDSVAFMYGSLERGVIFPMIKAEPDPAVKFYNEHGHELKMMATPAPSISNSSSLACMPWFGQSVCLLVDSAQQMEIVRFDTLIIPTVDNTKVKYFNWDVATRRIEKAISDLDTTFSEQKADIGNYLMASGSVVTGDWTLNEVDAQKLQLPEGSLQDTVIHVDSSYGTFNYKGGNDFRGAMNIILSEVETKQNAIESKISMVLEDLQDAYNLLTADTQFLANLSLHTIESDNIKLEEDLIVTTLASQDFEETVQSLSTDIFVKNSIKPISGIKTFNQKINTEQLNTEKLSDSLVTISPKNCLLLEGDQIVPVHKTFEEKVAFNGLKIPSSVHLSDGSSVSITFEDLQVIHNDIGGFFEFQNVLTNSTKSTDPRNIGNLSEDDVDNIVLIDEPSIINGMLEVNIPTDSLISGVYLKVINGMVNGHNLQDLSRNVVYMSNDCPTCARDINITKDIVFTGSVVTLSKLKLDKLNSHKIEDYVTKDEFYVPTFHLSNQTTLVTGAVADTVEANTFNSLNLNQVMTKTTEQHVKGISKFLWPTSFKSITGDLNGFVPKIDGQDLSVLFQSDLNHVGIINADVIFEELVLQEPSSLRMAAQINSMNVSQNMRRVVYDTDKNIDLKGMKTFESEVRLDDLTNTKIFVDDNEFSTDQFVNIKATETTINGIKRFNKTLKFRNIFMVDQSDINHVDFSKVIKCFVNIGSNETNEIHIYHPISFSSVETPNLVLEKNADSFACIPPKDISLLSAAKFVTSNPNLSEISLSEMLSLIVTNGIDIGQVNSSIELEVAQSSMIAHLLKENGVEVTEGDMSTRVLQLQQLVRKSYGLSQFDVSTYSLLELIQILCRKPTINNLDPSMHIALLDANNQFEDHAQDFIHGFSASFLTINGNVHTDSPVFGLNLEELDDTRVSLSQFNIMEGNYDFNSISIEENGAFQGDLGMDFDGTLVLASKYKQKFLDKNTNTEQSFLENKFTKEIRGTNFKTDKLMYCRVAGCEEINVKDYFDSAYSLSDKLIIDGLTFLGDLTLSKDTNLKGVLSDVNLMELAENTVIEGSTMTIKCNDQADITIQGTLSGDDLHFTGDKYMTIAPIVNKVQRMSINDETYPEFYYLPCTVKQTITGLASGPDSVSYQDLTLDECKEKCRVRQCSALSYKSSSMECIVMRDFQSCDDSKTDYVTELYYCWMQVKSLANEDKNFYLGVGHAEDNYFLQSSQDPESWIFTDGILLHYATDLAVSIPADANVGDKIFLQPKNSSDPKQYMGYTDKMNFSIKSLSSNLWVSDTNGTVTLKAEATEWSTEVGGVKFEELVNGVGVTRFFTKSTDQEVTGAITIEGDLSVVDSSMNCDFIGDLKILEVAESYDYDDINNAHKVKGNYTISGNLIVVNLTASTIGGRNMVDFVADTISKSTNDSHLTGFKRFSNVEFGSGHYFGSDLVNNFDLNAKYAATAFVDDGSGIVFEEPVYIEEAPVDITHLLSSAALDLMDPKIVESINLETLYNNSIRRDLNVLVPVLGTVIFEEGLHTEEDILTNYLQQDGDNIKVSDIVLSSDPVIHTTVNGTTRLFSNISVLGSFKAGKIFNYEAKDFLKVLTKKSDQNITGSYTFSGLTTFEDSVELSGLFNGFSLQNAVYLVDNSTLSGDFKINSLTIRELQVDGLLDKVDFDEMVRETFTLDGPQTIRKKWKIENRSTFMKKVLGNANKEGLEKINNQLVTELNAVKSVYDGVQAIKLGAQAEAATMCDYVSDLQFSYFGNQEILEYKEHSEVSSFSNDECTDSLLVDAPGGKVFAIVICSSIYVFAVLDGTMKQVWHEPQVLREEPLRIEAAFLSSNKTDVNNFEIVIFMSTGMSGPGVLIFKLRGVHTAFPFPVELSQVGLLEGIQGVTIENDMIFLLDYNCKQERSDCKTSIKMLKMDPFKSELGVCQVSHAITVYESDLTYSGSIDSRPRIQSISLDCSSDIVITITEFMDNIVAKIVRVVHLQSGCEHHKPIDLMSSMVVFTGTHDFTLISVGHQVCLITAGNTLQVLHVDMINKDVDRLYTKYKVENVKRLPSLIGEKDKFYGECNSGTIFFFEYAGIEGVKIARSLETEGVDKSVSSILLTRDDMLMNLLAYLTDDKLTVIEGVYSNTAKQVKMDCPRPEVTDALTTK